MCKLDQPKTMSTTRLILRFMILLVPLVLARATDVAHPKICDVAGYLKTPYRSADNTTTSLETCQHYCLIKRGPNIDYSCHFFGYDGKTRRCSIFALPPKSLEYRADPSSSTYFTEASCLGPSTSKCNDGEGANLVINGNFDLSNKSLGPWRSTGNAMVAEGAGINGSNALLCSGSCTMNAYRSDFCPNVSYSVTLDYKFVRAKSGGFPGAGPTFEIGFGDLESNDFTYGTNSFEEGKWQTFRATGLGEDIALVDGFPKLQYTSNVWHLYVDNVRVVRAPSASKLGGNLLKNGGFESSSTNSSNVKPWIFVNLYGKKVKHSVTSPGLSAGSKKKLQYSATAANISGAIFPETGAGFQLAQYNVGTEVGKLYQISFDYKTNAIPANMTAETNMTVPASISFGDSLWVLESKNQTSKEAALVKHFKRQTTVIANNPQNLNVEFSVENNDVNIKEVYVELDNFQVQEVL